MESHPYAKLFPMLGEAELKALSNDIAENGLRQKILRDKHQRIIDGRNRFAACELAGVTPDFDDFDGTDAAVLKLVISLNLHRRHLSESQRAMVAASLANMNHGGDRTSKGSIDPLLPDRVTVSAAASALSVGEATVKRARKVQRDGIAELTSAVVSGDITVNKAVEIAELPEVEQKEAVQQALAPKSPQGAAPKKPAKPEIPATAKSLIEAIKSLRTIAAKDSMRLSIVELREVVKRIEEAARHYVGRYME